MKLAFSTIACPDWTFEDIFSAATDLRFNGVELRAIENNTYLPKARPFLPNHIEKTKQMLKRAGLAVPMLASSIDLSSADSEKRLQEVKDYAALAKELDCPYIRIMCEPTAQPEKDISITDIAQTCACLCEAAGEDVTLLVETNGILANSDNMLQFLSLVGHENIGVLWDVHHPYRYFGEEMDVTYRKLQKHIRYVHVKDSVMENGEIQYKMMGRGDLPLQSMMMQLKQGGYNGYITLEWVKLWCPDLQEGGIVFPYYKNFMKQLMG